ncbi:copper resistance protein NlpE N-terminal domain-containing protein [Acinetobacter sp. ANC 4470]|uniref:copper resistance protein NlpE N-terminal domain-containing protein n=1 Tax=Acinetobacter sp. ANC 4470 TaxID=1977881 RepID=UPI00148AB7FA|nr:copper resistance protein NlpE N-terminal domain-containing protein [Acinetobacter sp. ANC 4470]
MKKMMILLGFFSILFLSSCEKSSNTSSIKQDVKPNQQSSTSIQTKTPDWLGHYKAFVPCHSCEKQLISLQLNQNKTYTLKEVQFFKQKLQQKKSSGTFHFNAQNSNLIQLIEDKTYQTRYISLHDQLIELLDQNKNRFENFEKYQIPKVHNIKVNNALKHVDIQADLLKIEKIKINSVENTKLTYLFEINNHSDRPLKLHDNDIVLVDEKNNEHISIMKNSQITPIQANKTQYELISFIYPESYPPAYIKIK